MPVNIRRKTGKKKTTKKDNVNWTAIEVARKKIEELPTNKAISFIRGMASVQPESDTSKELRKLLQRLKESQ